MHQPNPKQQQDCSYLGYSTLSSILAFPFGSRVNCYKIRLNRSRRSVCTHTPNLQFLIPKVIGKADLLLIPQDASTSTGLPNARRDVGLNLSSFRAQSLTTPQRLSGCDTKSGRLGYLCILGAILRLALFRVVVFGESWGQVNRHSNPIALLKSLVVQFL